MLASADSLAKTRRFLCSTVITLSSFLLIDYYKLLSVVLLACFSIMLWDQVVMLPFLSDGTNCMMSAMNALLAWAPLILVSKMYTSGPIRINHDASAPGPVAYPPMPNVPAVAFAPGPAPAPVSAPFHPSNKWLLTNVGFYGSPFVALLFVGITLLRLRRFRRIADALVDRARILILQSGETSAGGCAAQLTRLVQGERAGRPLFGNVREAEIVSRLAIRRTMRQEPMDEAAVAAAEAALMLGVAQFGNTSCMIHILHGCFLLEVSVLIPS